MNVKCLDATASDPLNRLQSVARDDGTSDVFGYYKDGELNTAQYNPVPTPTPSPTVTPTPTPTPTATPSPTPTVATPTYNKPAGTYPLSDYPKLITVTSTTPGTVNIRYTLDNTRPTAGSAQIANGGKVSVGAGHYLNAIAFKTGSYDSGMASGQYLAPNVVAMPSYDLPKGSYPASSFPLSVAITSTTTGPVTISYTTNGDPPTPFRGTLMANGGHASVPATPEGTTLKAIAFQTGWTDSAWNSALYSIMGTVLRPTFSPGEGNYYPAWSTQVTVSTQTPGAKIHYTINGATPTSTTGTVINGSSGTVTINFNSSSEQNLQAMACADQMVDSAVLSVWYTRDGGEAPNRDPHNGDATTTAPRSVTYNLDKAGNRMSVVDTGVTKNYTPNNLNQYYPTADGSAVTNGSEHEVSNYSNVSYSYINDERLMVASSTAGGYYYLYYDALGRCVKRTLGNVITYYVYDGEKPILEYNTAGGIVGRNLYGKGIDEILQRTDPTVNSGQPFYYQQDHEGSVTHLTNASGAVIEQYTYDAFGAPTTVMSSGTYNNRFKFTGREYSSTFGFYEYRARAYHPTLGRFMSEDPKGFAAGDYNLYRYVGNDPLDKTDPMGLEVGFGESLIPVWGSAHMAYDAFKENRYGMAVFYAGMAITDVSGAKALGAGMVKLGIKASAKIAAREALISVAEQKAGKTASEAALKLSESQAQKLKDFVGGLPSNAKDITVRDLPSSGKAFQGISPARDIPGSSAVYEKQVDSAGKTLQATKTTYGPNGEIVHVTDQMKRVTLKPE